MNDQKAKFISNERGKENSDRRNKNSFETEALPLYKSLFENALRLTRNRQDAEDLVHDTLFQAYRAWPSYTEGTNCGAWLTRIMKNRFINQIRAKSRAGQLLNVDELDESKLVDLQLNGFVGGRPDHDLRRSAINNALTLALKRLPDNLREATELFFQYGFHYSEIAGILEIQTGTVKSRIHRGRLVLKDSLLDLFVAFKNSERVDVGVYLNREASLLIHSRSAA